MATEAARGLGGRAPVHEDEDEQIRTSGRVTGAFEELGEIVRFSGRSLAALPGTTRYFSEILRQLAAIVPATILLMAFMQVMIGITACNFVYFLLKALGATDFTGIGGSLTLRTACVSMTGYVFVSKVCGGFVAELGAMKINQEVDALESTGVDPMRYIVGSRLIASILFIPIAAAVSVVFFYLGYYLTGVIVLKGVDGAGMNQFYWGTQSLGDFMYVVVSTTGVVLTTALPACYYGLRVHGGPAAVGEAVAHAIVINLMTISVLGMVLVTLWYGGAFGLPIGG
jgi:phospholipid/cholesterol/gamma-HCH transport system permease protein